MWSDSKPCSTAADVVMNMGTAGAFYRATGAPQLAQVDQDEPVYAVPVSAHMMRGRKL